MRRFALLLPAILLTLLAALPAGAAPRISEQPHEWADHHETDPGIALLQLMSEMQPDFVAILPYIEQQNLHKETRGIQLWNLHLAQPTEELPELGFVVTKSGHLELALLGDGRVVQVAKVTVRGWNPKEKKAITGTKEERATIAGDLVAICDEILGVVENDETH